MGHVCCCGGGTSCDESGGESHWQHEQIRNNQKFEVNSYLISPQLVVNSLGNLRGPKQGAPDFSLLIYGVEEF